MAETANYRDMTVKELEEKAREMEIPGHSGMRKDELIEAIAKQGNTKGAAKTDATSKSSSRSGSASGGSPSGQRSRSSGDGDLPGILAMLKKEHDEVKALFDSFEKQAERDIKGTAGTVETILDELTRHAEMEEQIVYPALAEADEEVYHEAHEEHHVAEVLMAEIGALKPDPVYRAKVTVLAENVRHHIEEEESEAFPTLRKLPRERLEQMATQWEATKQRWSGAKASAAR